MENTREINFENGKKITIQKGFWDYVWRCKTICLWDANGKLLEKFSGNVENVYNNMVKISTNKSIFFMTEEGCVRAKTFYSSDNTKVYHLCWLQKNRKLGVITEDLDPKTRKSNNAKITVPFEWYKFCQGIQGHPNRLFVRKSKKDDHQLLDIDNNVILRQNCFLYSVDNSTNVIGKTLLLLECTITNKIGAISIETGDIVIPFKYDDIVPYYVKGKVLLQCFIESETDEISEFFDKSGNIIIPEGFHNTICFSDDDRLAIFTTTKASASSTESKVQDFTLTQTEANRVTLKEVN